MLKKSEGRTFIHYGCKEFDKSKFNPITNERLGGLGKPFGGFWACDIHTQYGWKEYCRDNEMYPADSPRITQSFCFQLKEDARILHLETPDDFEFLPIKLSEFKEERRHNRYMSDRDRFRYVNWEAVRDIGIDAVEYIRTPYGHSIFYTWDFDSLLVLNPEAIVC